MDGGWYLGLTYLPEGFDACWEKAGKGVGHAAGIDDDEDD
jgi:hypothetical protein